MRRQDKLGSRQGLLLVEAVLSAVVIATGLVFISRALGGQLGALRRLEEADATLALARGKLLELESLRAAGVASAARKGTFDRPAADYGWALETGLRADVTQEDGSPAAAEASVTVTRDGPPASAVLTALWPSSWAQ